MNQEFTTPVPTRDQVDALAGPTILEFGTGWCGHCKAAQPLLKLALKDSAGLRHLKIEDGSGCVLGRTFGVTLWPTLIFLRDGKEVARLVRPMDVDAIRQSLGQIATT